MADLSYFALPNMQSFARALLCLAVSTSAASAAIAAPTEAFKDTPPRYTQASAQTRDIAERYFQAYLRKDWAQLEPLMAEQIQFRDTTAALVFGALDQAGKPRLTQYFRQVYPYIETHEFKLERSFFAGQQAVFVGVSDWSFAPPGQPAVRSRTPIVIALQVQGGQVIEHLEMGDLQGYVEAAGLAGPGK